jgi:hypothetical protein
LFAAFLLLAVIQPGPAAASRSANAYLPIIFSSPAVPVTCAPIVGESYGTLDVNGKPTDRPAEEHADLNLVLRSYEVTGAPLGFVEYGPTDDGRAPQLRGLYANATFRGFSQAYRVYDWNWSTNSRGALIDDWPVTLAGLPAVPGETLHVPGSGYDIGGYEVLVLYATEYRITLKYTREDNVVYGYTLHVEGVCVEPKLLALYREWNANGRGELPALRAHQAFGRAIGNEVGVAIRDTGAFMDPRSHNDWWIGVTGLAESVGPP